MTLGSRTLGPVKLRLDNLPASLQCQRQTLAHCFEAMDRVMPLRAVYLFGSHARGEAGPDSDVDLCLVAEGAERQLEAARRFREAMGDVWRCWRKCGHGSAGLEPRFPRPLFPSQPD